MSAVRPRDPDTTQHAARATRTLGIVYDLVALATIGAVVLSLFAGSDPGLYSAAGAGTVASFVLGFTSLRARQITLGAGTVRYARLWVWMTCIAGLNLIQGKWQPLAIFAIAGIAMTLVYAIGGWLGARATRPD